MRWSSWAVPALLVASASALPQPTPQNDLKDLLSDAVSLYTKATSVLAPVYTEAASIIASAAAATTSSSSSSSTSASSTSSTTSSSSSSSSSLSTTPSPTTTPPPEPTATEAKASKNPKTNKSSQLAIVLGSVFGGIALFILALLACIFCHCRRKRQRKQRIHSMYAPAGADDVDPWERDHPHQHTSGAHPDLITYQHAPNPMPAAHTNQPSMVETSYDAGRHQNPFVPVPPPPRITTANHRADLLDGPFDENPHHHSQTLNPQRDSFPFPEHDSYTSHSSSDRRTSGGLETVQEAEQEEPFLHHNNNGSHSHGGMFDPNHGAGMPATAATAMLPQERRNSISRKPVGTPVLPSRSPRRHRSSDLEEEGWNGERYYGRQSVGEAL